MSGLGRLTDEPPEPMSREDFSALQRRLRESWDGSVTLPKKDLERALNEIRWLKRRLRRVESVVQPLAEAISKIES